MSSRYLPFVLLSIACLACSKEPEPIDYSHAADFTYTGALHAGVPITFSSVSPDAKGYEWDFGDGTAPAIGQRAAHTFDKSGMFTVKLTASTAGGDKTSTQQLNITVDYSHIADFTYTGKLKIGAPIAFSSTLPGAQAYQWDISNSQAGTGRSLTYTFGLDGTFPVKLTASTANGPVTSTQQVTITRNDSLNFYFAAIAGEYRLTKKYTHASGPNQASTTACDILVTTVRNGDNLFLQQSNGVNFFYYPMSLKPSGFQRGYYSFDFYDGHLDNRASFKIGSDSIVLRYFYGVVGGSSEYEWFGKKR